MKMRKYRNIFQTAYNRLFLKPNTGTIGIGMIGVGGWGATNAINIMRSGRFNILGVYDINLEISETFSERYKVKIYYKLSELLEDPLVQAVCITIPNPYHAEFVKAAADAGKHVFIEKPLAASSLACKELQDDSNSKKVILQVGYQMRQDPAFRMMKTFVEEGTLGAPIFAQGIRTLQRPNKGWRSDPLSCPGGSMEQLGIHFIDAMICLFGQPISWGGWGRNIPYIHESADWGHVDIHFAKDVSGVVDCSFSSPSRMEFNLYFEHGQLRYDGKKLEIKKNNDNWQRLALAGLSGGVTQFVMFADCIDGKKIPRTDVNDNVLVAEILSSVQCKEK